ncbi:multidrug effflux MFS transporter [Aliikangiella maris]|uniref:Bcr/CflA family efflux transporter n=2 Tax=Aliikangiella maris TaxID=3162458 RepID=A0ABV3MSU0_9GAMM
MRILALFAAIFAITPLAIDMYLPALPLLAVSFESPIEIVQNSLSVFLAGFGFGMFIFGPLADHFGRRPLLIGGLLGSSLCSFALAWVSNIELFLVLRFLQAFLGGAATVVIPGAIREIYEKDTAKGLSYVSMIMMIAPMIAPAIGGYILTFAQWPLIFEVLGVYSAVMLVLAILFFPQPKKANIEIEEQNEANHSTATQKPLSFIRRYHRVLSARHCHGFLVISMTLAVMFFTYITSVSFLYLEIFEFSEQQFSLLFALNVGGLMLGNWINTRLVPVWGSPRILKLAGWLLLVASILFLLLMVNEANPYAIIAVFMTIIAVVAIMSTNTDAIILQQFKEHAGTATAVIGTFRYGCGALAGPILAFAFDGTGNPIAYLLLTGTLIVFITVQFNVGIKSSLTNDESSKLNQC